MVSSLPRSPLYRSCIGSMFLMQQQHYNAMIGKSKKCAVLISDQSCFSARYDGPEDSLPKRSSKYRCYQRRGC